MIKKLADRFFRWYCDPDYYPDIKGDLEELYNRNKENSIKSANWKYILQVIGLFRPSLIRSFNQTSIINQGMFRNYFKIGTRNLSRHKLNTSINVLGLAFGLVAFILIDEYVRFELSYDSFFEKSEQIYRLSEVEKINGVVGVKDAMTYHPAAEALFNELPEVINHTTTYKFDEIIIKKGHEVYKEKLAISADSNYLEMFSHTIISGSRKHMLCEPNSIVLTKTKANFYFEDEDPMGQSIELLGEFNRTFKVTGIIEDVSPNTHYKFNILLSDKSIKHRFDYDSWKSFNYYSYLLLKPGVDFNDLNAKLDQLSEKYTPDESLYFDLFPIKDIHLKSDYTYEPEIVGNMQAVSILRIISIFIMIIAWVNYINLSTARATERAKEVGLRKVIGAYKSQLILQFLFESLLVNGIATILALFVVEFSLNYFHQLIGVEISDHVWNHTPYLRNLFVFFVGGTIVSGFYPALVLSGFKPISVLKGKFNNSKSGIGLRRALVVFQFTASIVLIAGTLIINKQVKHMQTKDLGMSINYVIGFDIPDVKEEFENSHSKNIETFKNELQNHVAIESIGSTSNIPGGDPSDINSTGGKVRIVGKTEPIYATLYVQYNDDQFLETMDMQLKSGRDFDRNIKSDSNAVLVNESFLRRLNISQQNEALYEYIMFGNEDDNRKFQIIGIVEDFNRTSLKSEVEPTLFFPWMEADGIVAKLEPDQYKEGIAFIEAKWKSFFPDMPLDYSFLDDRFERLYIQDLRFGEVFLIFSILAILIASLGLFGLTSFMALQRTKEVGVRKVLGASINSIISIFYKDFIILLIISAIIGIPVIYFSMTYWLENYAFRINFPWILSILSVLIVISFALLTVGYQTLKVARLNPADTLKYE